MIFRRFVAFCVNTTVCSNIHIKKENKKMKRLLAILLTLTTLGCLGLGGCKKRQAIGKFYSSNVKVSSAKTTKN